MCKSKLIRKSLSGTGRRPLILPCSVKTDPTPESTSLYYTDDTHKKDTIRDTEDEKGYENVCSQLNDLKGKVQQLTSTLKLSGPVQIPDITNRLKTFAKIKEHAINERLSIERLEPMADKTMSLQMEHIINHQELTTTLCGTLQNNDTASKVQNQSSLQNTENAEQRYNVLRDLLRVHIFQVSKLQIYPFSLSSYFESISSGTPVSQDESMSIELLRVSSYSNFPLDISISLIKMAKTGFYYIDGKKTKCFSCGVTYDRWKSGDDPVVIHRMLSPSCVLVAEQSSSNQEARAIVGSIITYSNVDTRTVTIQDTENLIEENRQLRNQRLCKVCLDLDASFAFLPCGHIVCCIDCAPAMRKCPVCRIYIKSSVKTYLP